MKCSNLFDNDKMDDDVCVCVFSFVMFCWFIDFKGGFGHNDTWGNLYIKKYIYIYIIYLYIERERE